MCEWVGWWGHAVEVWTKERKHAREKEATRDCSMTNARQPTTAMCCGQSAHGHRSRLTFHPLPEILDCFTSRDYRYVTCERERKRREKEGEREKQEEERETAKHCGIIFDGAIVNREHRDSAMTPVLCREESTYGTAAAGVFFRGAP